MTCKKSQGRVWALDAGDAPLRHRAEVRSTAVRGVASSERSGSVSSQSRLRHWSFLRPARRSYPVRADRSWSYNRPQLSEHAHPRCSWSKPPTLPPANALVEPAQWHVRAEFCHPYKSYFRARCGTGISGRADAAQLRSEAKRVRRRSRAVRSR